ncbi:unnamed protein product [Larinioides sclopetarius]|uniref:Uncharacterized protein n=1 Tax=Larinioides sclopetarius TaxID=280406 RepID=A0AAV2B403_9ARAC
MLPTSLNPSKIFGYAPAFTSKIRNKAGLIRKGNEEYFIEPYFAHPSNSSAGHTHIIYKRSALRRPQPETEGSCGNVSSLYHDASIGNAINIVLVRLILIETEDQEKAEELSISQHADDTLRSFCRWQKFVNPKDDTHPNHHDVAILLTRYNICTKANEPCSTLGLAEVAGMCQPHRSCNVNEDTGLALAYTLTVPEILPAAVWLYGFRTAGYFGIHIIRDWGNCLDDEPSDHEFYFPELPPGAMYDAHHQCRLQYGPEAEHCEGIEKFNILNVPVNNNAEVQHINVPVNHNAEVQHINVPVNHNAEVQHINVPVNHNAEVQHINVPVNHNAEVQYVDVPVNNNAEVQHINVPVNHNAEVQHINVPVNHNAEVQHLLVPVNHNAEVRYVNVPVNNNAEVQYINVPVNNNAEVQYINVPVNHNAEVQHINVPVNHNAEVQHINVPVNHNAEVQHINVPVNHNAEVQHINVPVNHNAEVQHVNVPVNHNAEVQYINVPVNNNAEVQHINVPVNHNAEVQHINVPVNHNAEVQHVNVPINHNAEVQYVNVPDVCQTLWCRQDNKCVTRLEPAAEGTLCDRNMWCQMGRCTEIGERPEAIDGEWGQWEAWSPCSRTCGAGVSLSQRHCDNPIFRAVQCSTYDDVPYKEELHTWLPVATPMTPCQLHCKPDGKFFSVMLSDTVADGTECNPGTRDVCINGKCRHVACDWAIDSEAQEDRCGVCHGDGTQCLTIRGNFTLRLGLGYVEVVEVPSGARNVRIEEKEEAINYLAVQGENGEFYLNGRWFIQWSGEYRAAGTTLYYQRDGEKESLHIPGPSKEPLRILVSFIKY